MSWDLVMAIAQIGLDVCLLPTVIKPTSYVPRFTSFSTMVGLTIVAVALFNIGAPRGGLSALTGAALWATIFAYRGKRSGGS